MNENRRFDSDCTHEFTSGLYNRDTIHIEIMSEANAISNELVNPTLSESSIMLTDKDFNFKEDRTVETKYLLNGFPVILLKGSS